MRIPPKDPIATRSRFLTRRKILVGLGLGALGVLGGSQLNCFQPTRKAQDFASLSAAEFAEAILRQPLVLEKAMLEVQLRPGEPYLWPTNVPSLLNAGINRQISDRAYYFDIQEVDASHMALTAKRLEEPRRLTLPARPCFNFSKRYDEPLRTPTVIVGGGRFFPENFGGSGITFEGETPISFVSTAKADEEVLQNLSMRLSKRSGPAPIQPREILLDAFPALLGHFQNLYDVNDPGGSRVNQDLEQYYIRHEGGHQRQVDYISPALLTFFNVDPSYQYSPAGRSSLHQGSELLSDLIAFAELLDEPASWSKDAKTCLFALNAAVMMLDEKNPSALIEDPQRLSGVAALLSARNLRGEATFDYTQIRSSIAALADETYRHLQEFDEKCLQPAVVQVLKERGEIARTEDLAAYLAEKIKTLAQKKHLSQASAGILFWQAFYVEALTSRSAALFKPLYERIHGEDVRLLQSRLLARMGLSGSSHAQVLVECAARLRF